ncbi:polymorphic toxin type 50 domain-containing protein [Finegoldia magna]
MDFYTNRSINAITIHYGKTGVHLVPTFFDTGE